MHAERDILVQSVFPELRRRAASHCLYLQEVELRWGVTEEESGRATQLCLSEVCRCHLMVVILGERYGMVSSKPELPDLPQYRWVRVKRVRITIFHLFVLTSSIFVFLFCAAGVSSSRSVHHRDGDPSVWGSVPWHISPANVLLFQGSKHHTVHCWWRTASPTIFCLSFKKSIMRLHQLFRSVPVAWKSDFAAESQGAEAKMASLKSRIRDSDAKFIERWVKLLGNLFSNNKTQLLTVFLYQLPMWVGRCRGWQTVSEKVGKLWESCAGRSVEDTSEAVCGSEYITCICSPVVSYKGHRRRYMTNDVHEVHQQKKKNDFMIFSLPWQEDKDADAASDVTEQEVHQEALQRQFFGREKLLTEATEMVEKIQSKGGLMVVEGGPGEGKTVFMVNLTRVWYKVMDIVFVLHLKSRSSLFSLSGCFCRRPQVWNHVWENTPLWCHLLLHSCQPISMLCGQPSALPHPVVLWISGFREVFSPYSSPLLQVTEHDDLFLNIIIMYRSITVQAEKFLFLCQRFTLRIPPFIAQHGANQTSGADGWRCGWSAGWRRSNYLWLDPAGTSKGQLYGRFIYIYI